MQEAQRSGSLNLPGARCGLGPRVFSGVQARLPQSSWWAGDRDLVRLVYWKNFEGSMKELQDLITYWLCRFFLCSLGLIPISYLSHSSLKDIFLSQSRMNKRIFHPLLLPPKKGQNPETSAAFLAWGLASRRLPCPYSCLTRERARNPWACLGRARLLPYIPVTPKEPF